MHVGHLKLSYMVDAQTSYSRTEPTLNLTTHSLLLGTPSWFPLLLHSLLYLIIIIFEHWDISSADFAISYGHQEQVQWGHISKTCHFHFFSHPSWFYHIHNKYDLTNQPCFEPLCFIFARTIFILPAVYCSFWIFLWDISPGPPYTCYCEFDVLHWISISVWIGDYLVWFCFVSTCWHAPPSLSQLFMVPVQSTPTLYNPFPPHTW